MKEGDELIEPRETPINHGSVVRATWQFSLDTLRGNLAGYTPEAQELLVAVFRWCIDPSHPMSKPDFARRVGYSDSTINKIFSGTYVHPEKGHTMPIQPELLDAMREFLRLEQDRNAGGQTEYVATPTARKVQLACELARESNSIVILHGPSHVGKTWGLKHHAENNNHGRTVLVELDAASGLGGMVQRIATACGISGKSNTKKLIERIQRALTPNTLVIIDEMHLLAHTYRAGSFFSCVEVIRRIHDFTKCGMVLSWTHLDTLTAASQGELVQVWRRGVHKVALPTMPTKGDLAAILKHNGLEFPAQDLEITVQKVTDRPYEILRQVSKRDGLKAITERLRYGRKLANKSGGRLTWQHFVDAHLRIAKTATQEGDWL